MFSQRIRFVLAALLLEGAWTVAAAQYPYEIDTKPARGFMPNADQLATPFDNIDAVNGKLHLQLPLASLPRGRAGSGFSVDLVYDSHIYDKYVDSDDQLLQPVTWHWIWMRPAEASGGWTYNFKNYKLDYENHFVTNCASPAYVRMRVGLPDGSLHVLHLTNEGFANDGFYSFDPAGTYGCTNLTPLTGWLRYYTTDGSFLKLEIFADGTPDWNNKNWYLYYTDGRRVVGQGSQVTTVYDANSNAVHFANGCHDQDCYQPYSYIYDDTDDAQTVPQTLHRAIQIEFNTGNASWGAERTWWTQSRSPVRRGMLSGR